jgi:hypothetical protein
LKSNEEKVRMESIVPLAATVANNAILTIMFTMEDLESVEVEGVRITTTAYSNILRVNNTERVSFTNCEIFNARALQPTRSITLQNTGNTSINFTDATQISHQVFEKYLSKH